MSTRSPKRPKHVRAPNPNPVLVITGMTPAEVARLDAHVAHCNESLRAQGARTSRNAVVVRAIRELLSRICAPVTPTDRVIPS